MSTRKNPYSSGAYHNVLNDLRSAGQKGISRRELLNMGHKEADMTVVLSPRKESSRGDCRGNMSAKGEFYFVEKKARQIVGGIKEPQHFVLRWRNPILEPHNRGAVQSVASQKVATKTASKTETKEKATVKA